MKFIFLFLLAGQAVFAQGPTPTVLVGPIVDEFNNPVTGVMTIQSQARANTGWVVTGTSRIVYVTGGVISGLSLIPNDTSVPATSSYLVTFQNTSPQNPDIWICFVPTSNTPVLFTAACSPNATAPNVGSSFPVSQLIPGVSNGQVLTVVNGISAWSTGPLAPNGTNGQILTSNGTAGFGTPLSTLANSYLTNPSLTIDGTICTLGATCSLFGGALTYSAPTLSFAGTNQLFQIGTPASYSAEGLVPVLTTTAPAVLGYGTCVGAQTLEGVGQNACSPTGGRTFTVEGYTPAYGGVGGFAIGTDNHPILVANADNQILAVGWYDAQVDNSGNSGFNCGAFAGCITQGLIINVKASELSGHFSGAPYYLGYSFTNAGTSFFADTANFAGGANYFSNLDWVTGSIGSAVRFTLGATSGNTYGIIQQVQTGGDSLGPLAINPYGGDIMFGTTTDCGSLLCVSGNLKATSATITGTAFTLSGLGSASGTPSSLCLNSTTVVVNAALTCTVSSRDYKTAIADLAVSDPVAMLMQLDPVQFAYTDQPGRLRWGFIAEEVGAVDPKLADAYDSQDIPRSLDQNAILALAVKTIQEQQIEIEKLKSKLAGR